MAGSGVRCNHTRERTATRRVDAWGGTTGNEPQVAARNRCRMRHHAIAKNTARTMQDTVRAVWRS